MKDLRHEIPRAVNVAWELDCKFQRLENVLGDLEEKKKASKMCTD